MTSRIFRFSYLCLVLMLILTSCGKKKEQQIVDLQAKNDQLQSEFKQKDSLMNELFLSINAIERNLSDITVREKLIAEAPADEKRSDMDVREKIMEEIIMINNIMEENKKRLAMLKEQLRKSDANVAALQENIRILTQRIGEKEQEIASLKEELVRLNFTIESLNATIDTLEGESAQKSQVISQQDLMIGEMNTIWYVVGTKNELQDREIIDRAGGILNGSMKMNDMINPGHFTTADMRNLPSVAFVCKKAELVTVHPEGTYRFIVEGDQIKGIEILNPVEFWKSSRFLVVMTK